MKIALKVFIVLSIVTLVIAFMQSDTLAKSDKAKKAKHGTTYTSETESTPPGWSKGKKTGWGSGKYPPGWSKWDKKKRTKWSNDRDEAVTDIRHVCTTYSITQIKRNEITEAFSEAIAGGLIINDARKKLVTALKDKERRRELMIDTTQSVLELLK